METEAKIIKMIPFKDGRTCYISTQDINFEKNTMSFFIFDEGELQRHREKSFSVDTRPEGDVIVPLDEEGNPMFGLFKDMIFGEPIDDDIEHEMIIMYIFKELISIYDKSSNKEDFKPLLTFFESLNLKLKEQ